MYSEMELHLQKFFNTVGNTAFGMMFPILAGYIAMAIGERPALMPGIVGGLLAKAGTGIFLPEDQWISSGFFGALIAGFVAGYLMVLIKKLLEKLPHALEGTKPVLLYPFLGIVAMGAIMIFIVNPPMGAFNTWLNNVLTNMGEGSKITLGAVLGGMMAIDFGGPFNKAAMYLAQRQLPADSSISWRQLWQVVWFHRSRLLWQRLSLKTVSQRVNSRQP